MARETKIVHNPAPGVLLQISNPPSELAIGLRLRAIAEIAELERRQKLMQARAKDFIVG